ncbi:MAG: hypothetical protein JWL90_3209 [Chthoniobacteraceae bacterium]|nr:hypothetical protein [Chthoniobacteraceae bacterium]MDB6173932.1 hypothetical protein [Chthoniobacteraceae bacterium]
MKKIPFLALLLLVCVAWTGRLHSQNTVKTPLQQLQALKIQNQQLLEKQAATLTKLGEMEKEAQQLKFLTKRS